MESAYFKRFRMEFDLTRVRLGPDLPVGFRMVRWNAALMDAHARTKFHCFRDEIDAIVFPCLGDLEGCRRLMREISNKAGFSPCATWLVARGGTPADPHQPGTSHGVLESQPPSRGVLEPASSRGVLEPASSRGVLEQASSRGVLEPASSRGVLEPAPSRCVLEWCGTIQGVVDAEGCGSIQNVGVVPSLRGLGLGSCLIEQALAGFQRLGLRRAFLEVTADNKSAVRLYHRLGFHTVRTIYKTIDSLGRSVDQVGHSSEPALL